MSVAQAVARLGHAPARLYNLHSVTPGLSYIAFLSLMCFQHAAADSTHMRHRRSHRPANMAPAAWTESPSFRKYVFLGKVFSTE